MVVVSAQPQYRTVVDPPVAVTDLPDGVSGVQTTLCFREMGSTSDDMNYCPLGFLTFPNDNFDGMSMTLILRDGADTLPAAYPSGVGLLVIIKGVGADNHIQTLGTYISEQVSGEPGTLVTIGPVRADGDGGEFVAFTAAIGVNCISGFTGPHCIPLGSTIGTLPTVSSTTQQPTTPAVTTDMSPTTLIVTTESSTATESPTRAEPPTGSPTTAEPVTTEEPTMTTTAAETTKSPVPETTTIVTSERPNTEKPTITEETATTESLTTNTQNSTVFMTGIRN